MKIDKKVFTIQTFDEAADHQKYYKTLSEEEKEYLFFKLMQTAYGFVDKEWPRMDKNHFKVRSMIKNDKNKA